MYFKKNWGSMAEKEPPLGRIDIFQTSPNNLKELWWDIVKHIQDEQRFFNDLFDMLQAHCGKDFELVLHNLSVCDDNYDHTIVDIRNGHITNRKVGDWGDEDGLQILRGMLDVSDSYNEFMHTEAGHILRCSSMYIHASQSGQIIGSICINQDITRAVEAERFLRDYNMYRICNGGIFTTDISSVLDDLIQEAIVLVGKPVSEMKREDKIRFIHFLDEKGVFLITKSGTKICNLLNISKYTLYNYLGIKMPGGSGN